MNQSILSIDDTVEDENIENIQLHDLSDKWTLWAHLPHDTDWSLKSYKNIVLLDSVEATLTLIENFPEVMVKNCMLFLMRNTVNPIWEDAKNKSGGCFSYKVNNKFVFECWKKLSYLLVGESLLENYDETKRITGISISPKKSFCVIKIWMEDCSITDPKKIYEIEGMEHTGAIFKKHII